MPISTTPLPYGLRDVKVALLDSTDTPGTKVDLPVAQTFSFGEAEEFQELRGDDKIVAIRGKGPKVSWELEAGGISLQAYVVIAGGTLSLTGVTPNQIRKVNKKVTDARPYFYVEGQAISDSGGDFHAKLYKCRADADIEGELKDGEFAMLSLSGTGIGHGTTDDLYDLIHNETTTVIV
jgi:hypothetical protein